MDFGNLKFHEIRHEIPFKMSYCTSKSVHGFGPQWGRKVIRGTLYILDGGHVDEITMVMKGTHAEIER